MTHGVGEVGRSQEPGGGSTVTRSRKSGSRAPKFGVMKDKRFGVSIWLSKTNPRLDQVEGKDGWARQQSILPGVIG